MRSKLRVLGILLIAAGAISLVIPSLGFTLVEADRGVSVDTAADPNAYLGINDTSDSATISGPDDTATIFTLIDNGGSISQSDLTVSVVSAGGLSPSVLDVSLPPTSGDKYDVVLSCKETGQSGSGSGIITIDISVSGDVSVDATRTTDRTVDIDCTSGPVNIDENRQSDVNTESDVNVENGVSVVGNIDSGGTVGIGNGGGVSGNIMADDDVTIESGANVSGDITAGGDVTIQNGASVTGDITAGGDVTIQNGASVTGDITAGGDVIGGNQRRGPR